ncbi:DEAD/DEAH box helicase family protein [Tenggerimyces flavus]|uniref:DEAD/DEAH box helicase family protein n=1 Tax=Tenggerimyces flavus TaxID=1708749 RepID=A0ABV7Y5T1_9ACTN|nr:DEAD/DEAH box helicase family protein [Tenggerimyces flavus]MBM7785069.1 superfamily II DNA or RNA helicase [Tenggerimyces flavus]
MRDLAAAYAMTAAPYPLRVHQARALSEIDRLMVDGDRRRAWVVLPPGTGKTLVGLETIRRLGAQAVVFGPNTAIQSQWVRQWSAFTPATVPAGISRTLDAPVTALMYQALATFDADEEVDEEGHSGSPLMGRLHPNGRALVEVLRATSPLTIVLDECHHLLEVWGRLVAELLELVPHAHVLGLTATPPRSLTRDQALLVDELFGSAVYGTSIPSVVREGHLAPFAELAWLTTPTPTEADWLTAQAERFAELVTDLLDPSFGSTSFLSWLDVRFVHRSPPIPWHRLERDEPLLTAAALRLHYAGLLALPPDARLREEHRHPPTADDWVCLLDDWVRRCVGSDDAVLDELRRALPSVGYSLTRRGVRSGRSPVDRVLARSASKSAACVEITAAEARSLGDRLRMLILCDHERAAATLPATLRGVLAAEAGSARLVLAGLLADPRTRSLAPMLVTGRTVAAGAETATAFARYADVELEVGTPDADGIVELTGRWTSRTWVPLVTAFFEAGFCRVLVGTRGLLGEGWDARGVSGLVDLTTATTPTAVVQTRGRALRTDPGWLDKVAITWTVVCVTEDHPKGAADWDRFVRKHNGYFGIDETGEIVDGVAHVDDAFSPFAPPKVASFDAVNASMLARAEARSVVRALWRVGEPYDDRPVHTLRIRTPTARPAVVPAQPPASVPTVAGVAARTPRWVVPVAAVLALALLVTVFGLPAVAAVAALGLLGVGAYAVERRGRVVADAARPVDPMRLAYAVADGLHAAGLTPAGASAVAVKVDETGEYRIAMHDVPAEASREFAVALDEVLSPMTSPRYVVPRYVLDTVDGLADRLRAGASSMVGRLRPTAVVWHAVPTALGQNAKRVRAFAAAWTHWVSAGTPLYTGSPEGEGVLAAHRGSDPMQATTAMRLSWE